MKRIAKIFAIASFATIAGCATTGLNSMTGTALIADFTEGKEATNLADASKRGQACSKNYLGLYATGNSSIDAAKRNGGITRVSSVDHKIFAIGPFYGEFCTIVRGR